MDRTSFTKNILNKIKTDLGKKNESSKDLNMNMVLYGRFPGSEGMAKKIAKCKGNQEEVLVLNSPGQTNEGLFLAMGWDWNNFAKTLFIPGFDQILASKISKLDFGFPQTRLVVNHLRKGSRVLVDVEGLEKWISETKNNFLKKKMEDMLKEIQKMGIELFKEEWEPAMGGKAVLTLKDIRKHGMEAKIFLTKSTIITPAAKDFLREMGIEVKWKEEGEDL